MNKNLRESKSKWLKLSWIILSWTLIGAILTLYDHLNLTSRISAGVQADYDFINALILNCSVGFLAAISGGSFIVFVVNDKFRESPYWETVVLVALSFCVVSMLLVILMSLSMAFVHTNSWPTWHMIRHYLSDSAHIKNMVAWCIVVMLTQITLQINDKFGQGILWNLIIGRYHTPKEESRIFMFVDLVSSTKIAERIGAHQYHHFLRDFYADITNAIELNNGEIYQYVGDEIVITWRISKTGYNNDSLHCYFDMRAAIQKRQSYYSDRYGYVPEFKAGLHAGEVIAGEIGIIKRDVTFSGDVLNTASRIQGKCREYGVSILTSDDLLNLLPVESFYHRIPVGEVELRGKEARITLSTLTIINPDS